MPGHAVVAEIGQRMSQGGELPVQYRQDTGLGGVEHQVVQPVVPVHDGHQGLVACHGRDVLWQPGHQVVHLGYGLGDRGHVLLAPASDLALEVVAGFAVVGQTDGVGPHGVQSRHDAVHLVVDRASLVVAEAGQRLVPQHAAFDVLHHIKGTTDDGLVLAEREHACHRHAGAVQGLHDPEFALNGVSRGQQLGHGAGFGPHHIGPRRCDEFVSGIGLAPLEHLDAQRACKAIDVVLQPGLQGDGIDRVLRGHRPGAGEVLVVVHSAADGGVGLGVRFRFRQSA